MWVRFFDEKTLSLQKTPATVGGAVSAHVCHLLRLRVNHLLLQTRTYLVSTYQG